MRCGSPRTNGSPRLRSDHPMMRHGVRGGRTGPPFGPPEFTKSLPLLTDAGNSRSVPVVGQEGTMCARDHERVECMERTNPVEKGVTARAMTTFSAADEEKQRGVRRMKLTAAGLLLFVALVYALAKWADDSGAGPWAGYVAAASEAGMVGALADWFAVTALSRPPRGLPIPHTAIIPTKKDQLGVSLGEFVGENFLSDDVVRQRLRAVGIGSRLGAWLADPEHADRVTAELSAALRGALTVLRDSDVQAVVGEAITR